MRSAGQQRERQPGGGGARAGHLAAAAAPARAALRLPAPHASGEPRHTLTQNYTIKQLLTEPLLFISFMFFIRLVYRLT